jgi:uncharacterized membrane protein YcaP (DUF421 family)
VWTIDLPFWWHFVVRAVVVYVFLLVLLRFTGKRQVGQMAPFDLVLLLVLSNAVQNAMNGGDNSITGGIILASTLVGLNWGVEQQVNRRAFTTISPANRAGIPPRRSPQACRVPPTS